jgi:hypothetical protein
MVMYTKRSENELKRMLRNHKRELSELHSNMQIAGKIKSVVEKYALHVYFSTSNLSVHYYPSAEVEGSLNYVMWSVWEELDDILECDDYSISHNEEGHYATIKGLIEGRSILLLIVDYGNLKACALEYVEVTTTRKVAKITCT